MSMFFLEIPNTSEFTNQLTLHQQRETTIQGIDKEYTKGHYKGHYIQRRRFIPPAQLSQAQILGAKS
jgi:hypothetical protein